MKGLFIGAVVVTIMLNLGFQLIVLAQDASDTTISFATQMTDQLKCTHDGIPLTECQLSTSLAQSQTNAELLAHLEQTQILANNITTTYEEIYGITAP